MFIIDDDKLFNIKDIINDGIVREIYYINFGDKCYRIY